MQRRYSLEAWRIAVSAAVTLAAISARGETAREIVEAAGDGGGLAVHVGCDDGWLTASLGASGKFLVHGLDTDPANVERARRRVAAQRLYGRVSIDRLQGDRLPYVDNLVNLLVAEDLQGVPFDEATRVLAPGGVALISGAAEGAGGQGESVEIGGKKWWKVTRPWPDDIDQWTHYLHGPDNNAVAHDTAVGPPRHMQWLAGPQWSRNHHRLCSISSVVTGQGRLFYVVDEASAANINLPGKWKIVARDAFSGVLLWKKPMPSWTWHQGRFRSGPPQVTRLLVAGGDRLYVPLALNAPVSALDAVTGETMQTFEETAGAEEMVLVDGVLVVVQGLPVAEHAVGHPAFQDRSRLPNEKAVVAVDTSSGKTVWRRVDADMPPLPETLASDGKRVYVQVDGGVVSLDLKSGEELWRYGDVAQGPGKKGAKKITFGTHTLVVADGVVLCKLSDQLVALAAEDGRKLWQCPAGGGFHAPVDIFVIDGLVWQGNCVGDSISPPPTGHFSEGRDLHTGEVRRMNSVAVDLQTVGHHHRCYREKATDRFIITGKRGIELMDLAGDTHSRNNWVRGACQYGILPANGLLYAPPHACGCYMESKLRGFWALAADRAGLSDARSRVPEDERLEKGTAAAADGAKIHDAESWPMYRHDPLRSGVADTVVPAGLARAWKAKIGGRLTQPVVSAGTVIVSSVDENTIYALNETDGRVRWKYTADGRVDSPPSIFNGLVLFGTAGGRVHCLRLRDGEPLWRFLAAPADVRTVSMDRVESVWPVHGSVLVLDGVVYCSAGRSTWIDGGIDLYGLEPATGKVLFHNHFESRHPRFGEGKDRADAEHERRIDQNLTDYKTFLAPDLSDAFSMAGGTVSDVLTSDGNDVFLHHVRFNASLEKQDTMARHLFSTSSLLDDAENHRSHWVLGTGDFSRVPVAYSWVVNRPVRRIHTFAVPTGVLLVFDDEALWGVRRQGDSNGKYLLFKMENEPFSEDEEALPDFRHVAADQAIRYVWRNELPVRTTAMLKSGDHLVMGVMPIEIPVDDPHAAYEGRRGGGVWICSERDGSKVAQYSLDSPVTWDGMAAAGGKLFVSTWDGSVACFRGSR